MTRAQIGRAHGSSSVLIDPHFRLQEWVAEEKGYFADEGLDYVFREQVQATDGKIHDQGADRKSTRQLFRSDRSALPAARMGSRGKGLLRGRGPRLRVPRAGAGHRRQDP